MKLKNRFRPRFEQLEDRWTPAVDILFDGANLAVTGNPGSALTITQNAADVTVSGVDAAGAYSFGPYAVTGNVSARLSNAIIGRTITLAFGVNATSGSWSVNSGNSSAATDFVITGTGAVTGDLSVVGGNGVSTLSATGIDVNGSVSIDLKGGADTISNLFTDADSVIGGNVTLRNVNTLGSGAVANALNGAIGGSLTIDNSADPGNPNIYRVSPVSVGGNVMMRGSITSDSVTELSGNVAGNGVVVLSNGINAVVGNTATFLGSFTYLGGNNTDVFNASATSSVAGNMTINLGNGANTAVLANTVLGRQVNIRGGNQVDFVNLTGDFAAVGARLSAFLGNGSDTFSAPDLGPTDLASLYIDFGNAPDTYIAPTIAPTFRVTLRNK